MKANTLYTCPAYDIIEARYHQNLAEVRSDREYAIMIRGQWELFYASSVASYALEYNEDPIEAYQRAVEHGHETHWLGKKATSLTAHKRARETYEALSIGQHVYFQGRRFEIRRAANDNVKLVELTK